MTKQRFQSRFLAGGATALIAIITVLPAATASSQDCPLEIKLCDPENFLDDEAICSCCGSVVVKGLGTFPHAESCASSQAPDTPPAFSPDCSTVADAVEEARHIDLERQAREQAAAMQPYLRDWSKPGDDPEGDYWHIKGNDPRQRSSEQQLKELGDAISSLLGFEEGEVPDVDSEPPMKLPTRGPLPVFLNVLEAVRAAIGVLGEIRIQRNRDYQLALDQAEADLQGQIDALSAQAERFGGLAEACGNLSASDGHLLQMAEQDIRVRQAVVHAQLDAIRKSSDRVKASLDRYYEQSPPESTESPSNDV